MGIPLIFIVAGLPLMTLSLASTLTDAPNCTGTPTLNDESPIVPGVDVPLGLVTTPPKLKHGFAIEQGAVDGPPLTIHVQNNGGVADLQVAWQRDPSSPANLNGVYNGPLGESTMGVYPTGWSGRIAVGRNSDPNVIQKGSVIEASFIDGSTTVDVSYVKGYSVPITCSVNGAVVTGCDNPLFWSGIPCPGGLQDGPICYNLSPLYDYTQLKQIPNDDSSQPQGTPAQDFFQPCQGAAVTYPNDLQTGSLAANLQTNEIFCCVGHGCPHNPSQPAKKHSIGAHVKRYTGEGPGASPADDA